MSRCLCTAGFVLCGGASSRMGRDKALLPVRGAAMIEHIAESVRAATGNVTLIGPVERYASLGLRVEPDLITGCGPLGGVYTALEKTRADWNLIVACDMPDLTEEFLRNLVVGLNSHISNGSNADCLVPETTRGLEPLCALYHRRCALLALAAIHRKSLKMQDFVSTLHIVTRPVADFRLLTNVNTPAEWEAR